MLFRSARRSNTYPLSETSGDDLDSSIHMCFTRPTRISTANVIQMKLTPKQTALAPLIKENLKSRERSSFPSPENVHKKSSCLQISLQPTRYSGCLQSGNVLADGDDASFTCVLKDGSAVVDNELNAMDGFGWTPGVGDGQGGLACCGSWGRRESDTTELNINIQKC